MIYMLFAEILDPLLESSELTDHCHVIFGGEPEMTVNVRKLYLQTVQVQYTDTLKNASVFVLNHPVVKCLSNWTSFLGSGRSFIHMYEF